MGEPAGPVGLVGMRRALVAHAERLQVPVSLDVLCLLAEARWAEAAVAVSVPIRVVGAAAAQTVAAAALARKGEELQVTIGEGPSLDVLGGAGPIDLADLAGEGAELRWPLFAPAAVLAGVGSMVVLPMRVGAARFGALAVYQRQSGGLDPADGAEAIVLASIALDLLLEHLGAAHPGLGAPANGGRRGPGGGGDRVVTSDVDDRPEIHQATGMLSIQLEVDMPTALLRLRARAFAENRLLSYLAADVVSRVVRFDGDQPSAADPGGGPDEHG